MTFEPLKNINSGIGSTLGDYKFLYGFVSMIRPHHIAEIGTNTGGSTIAMAMALRDEGLVGVKIFSVDINKNVLDVADRQLRKLGLRDYAVLLHGDSKMLEKATSFDMVFIDGGHSYEDCATDFNRVKNKSHYVVFHDSRELGPSKLIGELRGKHDMLDFNYGNLGIQWSQGKPVCNSFPGIAIVRVK